MKTNYPIWYLLLFLVVITGALASMALNGYGMKLLGAGCAGFTLAFLHELVVHLNRKLIRKVELVLLAVVCLLLASRNLFIEIPGGQTLTATLFALLTALYVYHGFRTVGKYWNINRRAALAMLGYYGALVSFLAGFLSGLVSVSPNYGTAAGIMFMLLFVAMHFASRPLFLEGEETTAFQLATLAKNKSAVVLAALLVTGFIYTLMQYHALPPLYAGDMPVGYTRLVQRAESGQDTKAASGMPRHREFRKAYRQFLKSTR